MVRPLFVAGSSRSGTTALVDYLNAHEQVLICRERYKYVCNRVTPEWLTFENILDYEPGQGRKSGAQTNVPRKHHVDLLSRKDPAELRWIGDKYPNYVRHLATLCRDNPGAKFIFTYRPIEEVAESHEERSRNPDDPWLGGKNGFEIGVKQWNDSLKRTRDFIESEMNPSALIISYHDFFGDSEASVPLISHFLGIEFDESVRESWREMSRRFESSRRQKEPLTKEQIDFIERRKDGKSEEWILERINRQWENLELANRVEGRRSIAEVGEPRELATAAFEVRSEASEQERRVKLLKRRVGRLREELSGERQRAGRLEKSVRRSRSQANSLKEQLSRVKSSRGWMLLTRFGNLRSSARRRA